MRARTAKLKRSESLAQRAPTPVLPEKQQQFDERGSPWAGGRAGVEEVASPSASLSSSPRTRGSRRERGNRFACSWVPACAGKTDWSFPPSPRPSPKGRGRESRLHLLLRMSRQPLSLPKVAASSPYWPRVAFPPLPLGEGWGEGTTKGALPIFGGAIYLPKLGYACNPGTAIGQCNRAYELVVR